MFSSMQSIPGLIFARSDVKAKIRPGVEARVYAHFAYVRLPIILYSQFVY